MSTAVAAANVVVEANKLDLFEILRAFKFLIGDETLDESTRVVKKKNPDKQHLNFAREEFREQLRQCLAEMRRSWFQVRTVKRDRETYLKYLFDKKFTFDFGRLPPMPPMPPTMPPMPPTIQLIPINGSSSSSFVPILSTATATTRPILPKPLLVASNTAAASISESEKKEIQQSLKEDINRLSCDKDKLNKHLTERLEMASAEMIRLRERLYIAQKMYEEQRTGL